MKKLIAIALAIVLVLTLSVTVALAAPPEGAPDGICACEVVTSSQGKLNTGSPIPPSWGRNNHNSATGAPDGSFFSLGFVGGSIVLEFCDLIGGELTVYEITSYTRTGGDYPEEYADVYGSLDGSTWTFIGTANNFAGKPDENTNPTTLDLGDACYQYVKIVDASDDEGWPPYTRLDGFDLDAVCAEPCPQALEVPVDIKPRSCPNPLNVKSKGVLPVAILGTEDFDVTQVDPASVLLEGVSPLRWAIEDVATPYGDIPEDCEDCTTDGPDGYQDLTLKFDKQEVVAALGDVSDRDCKVLQLTGNLKEEFGGTAIAGEDYVVILKKGKP